MVWFKKKKMTKAQVQKVETLEEVARAETAYHKNKVNVAAKKASRTGDQVNSLFAKNGFSMTIHAAAGGKK